MNEKPNTQPENNDLDSLLQEFQTLSTTNTPEPSKVETEPVRTENITPVQTQENVAGTPVQQNPVENEVVQPTPVQVEAKPSTNVVDNLAPVSTTETVSQFSTSTSETPSIDAVSPTVTDEQSNVSNISKDPAGGEVNPPIESDNISNNGGGKGNLIFIFVILLIVGLFIFFIPTISDFLNQKPGAEKKPTATPTTTATATPEVAKEKKMTCTGAEVVVNDNQSTQTNYRIHYLNNKVTKVERIFKNIFNENIDTATDQTYANTKTTCDMLATTYANITGYAVTCEEKDKTFNVTYAYDLETFVNPTQITINDNTETITSDIKYGDSIDDVKTNMTSNGLTCK